MATNDWATWQAEIGGATVDHQNLGIDDGIVGYYRMESAKTKPSFPVALWRPDNDKSMTFQIGRQRPMSSAVNATEWAEFLGAGWLHCRAVRKSEWDAALVQGVWADGKASRQRTDDERFGLDPGDNQAPREELLADQIAAAVDTAKAITTVANAEEAKKANELAERLRGLYKAGDAERDKEKRPHDEAARKVQAKWLPVITPAETEQKRLGAVVRTWLKAEEVRVAREAREAAAAKQDAIDKENERIRLANIEAAGNAPIGAEPELEAELPPAKVDVPKVQAASTFGRAAGLRTVKKGEITDIKAFALALVEAKHPEFLALAQTLANRAAKAGIPLAGMKIIEVRE